jgi:general secretion pathway protein D
MAACVLVALPVAGQCAESSKTETSGGIEISDLISRVAKRTGKQFVIDPRVRAQIPLAGIEAEQVSYEQLLAILEVHQYAVTDAGGILAVVPDANARSRPAPVHGDVRFQAADYELVTLLSQPKNLCAAFLVPVLRPLMPQSAHLAAEIQSNTLIINDRAVHVRRIAVMVEQLDRRSSGKKECPSPSGVVSVAPAASPAASPSPAKPGG